MDDHGVMHFALPALLETPLDVHGCHGVVTVSERGVALEGFGDMMSCGAEFGEAGKTMHADPAAGVRNGSTSLP